MMNHRKLLLALALLPNAFAFVTYGKSKRNTADAELVFMSEAAYPPFSAFTNNELVGFDIELVKLVCTEGKIDCAHVSSKWGDAWPGHKNGFAGAAFLGRWYHASTGSGNTFDRRQIYSFSDPYTKPIETVMIKDKTVTLPADLAGKKCGFSKGFACGKPHLSREFKCASITEYEDGAKGIAALTAGDVECFSYCGADAAQGLITKNSGGKHDFMNTGKFASSGLSFMFRSDDGYLVDKVNVGIRALKAEGETGRFGALCKKYTDAGTPVTCDFTTKWETNIWPSYGKRADISFFFEAAYPPFNNFDAVQGLYGFDTELVKAICKLGNLKCAWISAPWKGAWPGAQQGFAGTDMLDRAYDATAASGNNFDRRQIYSFSDPYTTATETVFIKAKGATMPALMDGKICGAPKGFVCGKNHLKRKFKCASITEIDVPEDGIKALVAGSIEVFAYCGVDAAAALILKYSAGAHDYVSTNVMAALGLSFMARSEDGALIDLINTGIRTLKATGKTGEYGLLCKKYEDAGQPIGCDYEAKFESNIWKSYGTKAEMVFAMEAAYPPLNNFDPVKGLYGFDTELIKLVCTRGKINCAWTTTPWSNCWPGTAEGYTGDALKSGWAHACTGAGNTFDRRQTYSYSDPYTKPIETVMVKAKATTLPADLAGTKCGFSKGFACGKPHLQREFKCASITEYASGEEGIKALKAGTVEGFAYCGPDAAQGIIDKYSGGDHNFMNTGKMAADGLSFMFSATSGQFIAKINTALRAMKAEGATGTYGALCKKYLDAGTPVDCDFKTEWKKNIWENQKNDITFMMSAVKKPYNEFDTVKGLWGFDTELVKLLCAAGNLKCSWMTAPWAHAWPDSKNGFPGDGFQDRHFHASTSSAVTKGRQQTLEFTDTYTQTAGTEQAVALMFWPQHELKRAAVQKALVIIKANGKLADLCAKAEYSSIKCNCGTTAAPKDCKVGEITAVPTDAPKAASPTPASPSPASPSPASPSPASPTPATSETTAAPSDVSGSHAITAAATAVAAAVIVHLTA